MTQADKLTIIEGIRKAYDAKDMAAMADAVSRAVEITKEARSNDQGMYERYIGNAPILNRVYVIDGKQIPGKINQKLPHDFIGEIVDDKVGFMLGHGIAYSYDDPDNQKAIDRLSEFVKAETIQDHDTEVCRATSVSGAGYRLLWHEEGVPHIEEVDPWNVIYVEVASEKVAIILYEKADGSRADCYFGVKKFTFAIGKAEDTGVVYDQTGEPPSEVARKSKQTVTARHMETADTGLAGVPVFEYLNNRQRQGDCAKALHLIDQYDRLTSDTYSEMEQFRLAYFAVFGAELPDDKDEANAMFQRMQQTGVMVFPPHPGNPSGGSGQFIVKQIDAAAVKMLLDMLEEKIYRFCRAINYGRDALSGASATGVVLKQRLQQIRHKCLTTWSKMQSANREMWKMLGALWTLQDVPFDYLKVKETMTLDIPTDVKDEAALLGMLEGKVSRRTALEQVSFITDVDAELRRMEEEGLLADLDPSEEEKAAAAAEIAREVDQQQADAEDPGYNLDDAGAGAG